MVAKDVEKFAGVLCIVDAGKTADAVDETAGSLDVGVEADTAAAADCKIAVEASAMSSVENELVASADSPFVREVHMTAHFVEVERNAVEVDDHDLRNYRNLFEVLHLVWKVVHALVDHKSILLAAKEAVDHIGEHFEEDRMEWPGVAVHLNILLAALRFDDFLNWLPFHFALPL